MIEDSYLDPPAREADECPCYAEGCYCDDCRERRAFEADERVHAEVTALEIEDTCPF